jgi:hypothetical protein
MRIFAVLTATICFAIRAAHNINMGGAHKYGMAVVMETPNASIDVPEALAAANFGS